jgi:hypothetical protein
MLYIQEYEQLFLGQEERKMRKKTVILSKYLSRLTLL